MAGEDKEETMGDGGGWEESGGGIRATRPRHLHLSS